MIKSMIKGMKVGVGVAVGFYTFTTVSQLIGMAARRLTKALKKTEEKVDKMKEKLETEGVPKEFKTWAEAYEFLRGEASDDLK